jgi:hypothetical protein
LIQDHVTNLRQLNGSGYITELVDQIMLSFVVQKTEDATTLCAISSDQGTFCFQTVKSNKLTIGIHTRYIALAPATTSMSTNIWARLVISDPINDG